jgi:hypothetical protein
MTEADRIHACESAFIFAQYRGGMLVTSKIRRSKLIVLPVVFALSISPLFPNGIPQAHAFDAADAKTAIEAYNDTFWDASAKYFWKNSNHDGYQDFWVPVRLEFRRT